MRHIDVAIFAHNEEKNIGSLLKDVSEQSILEHSNTELQISILCNGCEDRTIEMAQDAVKTIKKLDSVAKVINLEQAGKTRTWNRFISDLPDNSKFVIFIDGDIRLPDNDTLFNLVEDLEQSSALAATSRPLKDLSKLRRKPVLLAAASLIGREHQDGPICGQLYASKAEHIRQVRLPVPCLVEDGFLSACLITGLFSHQGRPELVKASQRARHYFEPPSSIRAFFSHDVRLALGCELNAALYSDLWAAQTLPARFQILEQFAESQGISKSISEHIKHPERSALHGRISLNQLTGKKTEKSKSQYYGFLIRLAHYFYKYLVRRRAKRSFAQNCFQW